MPTSPRRPSSRHVAIGAAVVSTAGGLGAHAQQPGTYTAPAPYATPQSYPAQSYPTQSYPSQAYPAQSYPAQAYPAPQTYPGPQPYAAPASGTPGQAPGPSPLREFFARTLAAVAQVSGAAAVAGLTQAIGGGITYWFDKQQRKKQPRNEAPTNVYAPAGSSGAMAYPASGGYGAADPAHGAYAPGPDDGTQPAYPPQPGVDPYAGYAAPPYPPPAVAGRGDASAYGAMPAPAYPSTSAEAGGYAPASYYDPASGTPLAPNAIGATLTDTGIYAGLAYEIHVLAPSGAMQPVDPARYEFRTGERFVVLYRPTLPGRIDVYNINPAGRQSLIDSAEVAAADLARLGPYEFTALTGDEQLRLVLAPCSTAQLVGQTRDIVRVEDNYAASAAPPLGLAACTAGATRSVRAPRTRDIRKVAAEGPTGFALDPVSAQELASGRVDPREITILFRHR